MDAVIPRVTYKASLPQVNFLNLETRHRGFVGGVGSGKTYAGALGSLRFCLKRPGMTGLVGTKTYPMLRDVVIPTIKEVFPKGFILHHDKTDNIMHLTNGSTILFRSMEREMQIDRLRGLTVNWVWLDEAAYLPEYAFRVVKGRMRQGNKQVCQTTSTPKGFNWIFDYFVENGGRKRSSCIKDVSTFTNPFLPPEYIEDLEESYTGLYYEQEIEAQFVTFEGLVYTEFSRPVHVLKIKDVRKLLGEGVKRWIFGYDSGYTNPRVLLKIAVLQDGSFLITDEWYQSRVILDNAMESFLGLYEPGAPVFCDPSAPEDIQKMKTAGMNAQPANNAVQFGIQQVKSLLYNNHLYVSELCPMTISEFGSYQWNETKDEPIKRSDHGMDGLRYALVSKPKAGGFVRRDPWRGH